MCSCDVQYCAWLLLGTSVWRCGTSVWRCSRAVEWCLKEKLWLVQKPWTSQTCYMYIDILKINQPFYYCFLDLIGANAIFPWESLMQLSLLTRTLTRPCKAGAARAVNPKLEFKKAACSAIRCFVWL